MNTYIKNLIEKGNVCLKANEVSLDDFLDAIILFWNISFDHGLETDCINNRILTQDEILKFPEKVEVLFEKAIEAYPNSSELIFWKLYINEMNLFSEGLHEKRIRQMLNIESFFLPHFYLMVQFNIVDIGKLKSLKNEISTQGKEDSYRNIFLLSYLNEVDGL
jgi:hypothetical protein